MKTLYLLRIAAMPSASLPKSPGKSFDVTDYATFEREIRFPNQRAITKDPETF